MRLSRTPDRREQRPASSPPRAAPVPGSRLENRQGGENGGLGAQHPRAEPDPANNGKFAESVKLRFGEAALGADRQRDRRGLGQLRQSSGDRLAGAALVADDEPPLR